MEAYQERVVEELNQLTDRKTKLQAFMDHDTFKGLGHDDQDLLRRQLTVMQEYELILQNRVRRFK